MHLRPVLLVVLAAALVAGALPAGARPERAAADAPAAPQQLGAGDALPDLDAVDPVRFDYDDAVVEHHLVTTRNGLDQMWVDVIRPDTDEPVPTIMMASPYFNTLGRGWRGEFKAPHQGPSIPTSPGAPGLSGSGEEVGFPEWYDEYFVPRGYAYVAMDSRGTRNSSGCQVYGDRDEVFDAVDVVDWVADQDWSNGKVGMTGGSYDGTIAIGAAAEQPLSGRHPDALAAVIPVRAIGRWYDYHFFNGVQSSSHRLTPALFTAALAGTDTQNSGTDDVLFPVRVAERKACIPTLGAATTAGYASPYQDARADFWRERDFRKDAGGMRAAMFLVSGLFDYNVKNNNTGYLWESLPERLPRRLWLFNGDHVDPHVPTPQDARAGSHVMPFPFQDKFVEGNHRWWLQFLKGVEAGALATPQVEVQRADGAFDDGGAFPAAGTDRVLSPTADGLLVEAEDVAASFSFRGGQTGSAPASHTVVTEPFDRDTRLSGQVAFDLLAQVDGPDASVAATILSVPPGADPDGATTVTMDGTAERPLVIGYGWVRGWYRDSVPLRGVSTPTGGGPLTAGETTRLRFGSLHTDVVVPEGHRLAIRFSSNAGGTVPAENGGDVTVLTGRDASRILLPVADPVADEAPPPPRRARPRR